MPPPRFNDSTASLSSSHRYSPRTLFVSLIILIFVAETVTMAILYFIKSSNYLTNTLLDELFMIVLIFPGLYFLQLRPILIRMEEQAKTELSLRTSEARLKKILEIMPVGVWIVNKDGDITHVNQAGQEVWAGAHFVGIDGYPVYKARWAATGEWVKPDAWAATRAITQGETSIEEEINIEAFDGTPKIILNSAVPIYDENNVIQGAVVVNQDITQRRQMEKERVRTNELMERFFNSIHSMIAFMDKDFNLIRVNQAYADSGGHPIDYFIGKNHFDLYPHAENQAIFQQVVETRQPYVVFEKPFEYAEFPERGITYWDWSLQPVIGQDDSVEGVVLSLVDVSRRKLAELRLERQNQALRELTETEHRQRMLAEGLVQSVIALNTSLESTQVLHTILEQTRKAIPFNGADILLVEGNTWRVAASLGFENYPEGCPDLEKLYVVNDYPLLQQVCSSGQPLIVDSANEHPGWHCNTDMTWVRSFAAVPFTISGSAMGIVELYSQDQAAFDQDTAKRLLAFAAPAGSALRNAQLYQAETEARRLAETMRAAAQALSQTLDLDQVIHTLLDYVQIIVGCDTCGLTLMEGEDRWILRALRGYYAWADQDDIPTVPLNQISTIVDSPAPHGVLVIQNENLHQVQEQGRNRALIRCWAVLPILINAKVIGFVELGKAGAGPFLPEQTQWAEALVVEASVAIQNAWLFEQVRSSSMRLQSLARKLVELQEKERYHIARELHDDAGQVLSSLKISLGRLEQDPDCPPHIRQRLDDLKNVNDCVLEDLHRLAMDLRPVALDHLGLVAALEQLANHLNCDGLSVKFKALGMEGERLPQDMETSLYRIVQEALTNVLNHAHASNVGVLLERNRGKLKLFVEDDGIGFTPEGAEGGEQLGLVGMRERAEMFGGSLSIESSPGSGTSIIVEVPDVDTYPHRR